MATRAQLEALRTEETKVHNQRMQAYDAMIGLVDPKTGELPQHIMELFKFTPAPIADAPPAPQPQTLRPMNSMETAIWTMVNNYAEGSEWTSRSIRDSLEANHFTLPANVDAAMNSIGYALAFLVESGRMERFHQGSGRDPHRYRRMKGVL